MTPVGISSGCCPELTGPQLAASARQLGVDVVDLRAGKGHAWECDGVAPLRAAGLRVAFVGMSLVLGRPGQPCEQRLAELDRLGAVDVPVKVFADQALDVDPLARQVAREQVNALQEMTGVGRVLVETHHGYAGPPALAGLCAETGCRLLLDTLGLAKLHGGLDGVEPLLGPYIVACQVKGYDTSDPAGTRHLPLRGMDPAHVAQVRRLVPPGAPVLVESKAGVLADDVAVLRSWFAPSYSEGRGDA
ncbi:MAG: hypothetical protein JWP76_2851 [Dactylosporangium sp.]|jgi:hypothetical protein|nr:hypothetical protein [Dactylosporangium sp.]